MANPTTNFGWVMPTSTSLVTNLPADFNTFGQAVDTSMSELLGGTTGQVLSKTSNTNMDFTWVTPTDQTPLTTKGDLFTFTTVDARLAVGANGETLVADSSTSTGLRYQGSMPAGKNFAINGNFDIWQRGTSFPTQGVYTADRWYNTQSANITGSQQTSGAPDGSRYIFRQTATSTGGYYTMSQVVETANASQLWGKTVTFSIKLKRNSTFNAGTEIKIAKNAAVDANPGTVWTTIASTAIASGDISTSGWTTFFVTATIPNDGTANSVMISHYYQANPANGSILELAQAQLELGSVPTTFARAGGTIQGEYSACQRYYERVSGYSTLGAGRYFAATQADVFVPYKVTKRTTPTFGSAAAANFNSSSVAALTAITTNGIYVDSMTLRITHTGTSSTTGYACVLTGDVNAYIEVIAEL